MYRAAIAVLLLWAVTAYAENTWIVQRIDIDGLRRTKRWVVERELGFGVGDTIRMRDLRAARKRLENLSIFNSVYLRATPDGVVYVRVPELWPLWPVLNASLSGGTKMTDLLANPKDFFKHATLTAGGTYINSFGTAGRIYAVFNVGATQGVDLQYRTRWFSPRFPYAVQLGFQDVRETTNRVGILDSLRFLSNFRTTVDIATRQGAPSRVGFKMRYWAVHVENGQANGVYVPDPKRYRTVWFNPYVILDRRDLEWYPTRGGYSETHVNLVTGNTQFILSSYDLRGYFPFKEGDRPPLLALRLSAATSTASTPRWAHYFYPFSNALRGFSDAPSEAGNYIIGNAELRFPLGPESTYNVPYIGHYGKNWPWGISAMLFAQRGELGLSGHRFERTGYGGGFYLRIPYFELLQASATFRPGGHMELALSTGVSF